MLLIITILHIFLIRDVLANTLCISQSVKDNFSVVKQCMNINILPFPTCQLSMQLGSTNPRLIDIVEEP